jgi:hypothetical protein
MGLQQPLTNQSNSDRREKIFEQANKNANTWAQLLWISGGNLNHSKCFHYYLEPSYNHATNRINYSTSRKAPGTIMLSNPATNTQHTVERVEPTEGRRFLGVILAPDGNCRQQIRHCIAKSAEFIGKIKHRKLSKVAKWKAATTILDAQIQYPLMATLFTRKDLEKIDRPITWLKCAALGLNKHFPRAVLHGPMEMGGMGLPTKVSTTAVQRINYFLYHVRQGTTVGEQL